MPFKRKGSPFYQVRRKNLPGYGDTGQLSSGVRQKTIAQRMELALEDLARDALTNPKLRRLLDAVCRTKEIDLATLLVARNSEGGFESLLVRFQDPLLADVIQECITLWEDSRQTVHGLNTLLHYVPARARLSYLCDPALITRLCQTVQKDRGIERNSVRRYFLRAISKVLTHRMGKAHRDRIFAEIDFKAEDDTREIHLTPDEIDRLLSTCREMHYHELELVIRLALLTSADRGVLLNGPNGRDGYARGLLRRDLRIYAENGVLSGEVTLHDGKTRNRTRTVPLTRSLCEALLPLVHRKADDDPVFEMGYTQLDVPWRAVRKRAGLDHVRFKDLRAQVAQYGEEAGVPLTVIVSQMGHDDERTTRRYQKRQAVMSPEHAAQIEASMGLSGRDEAAESGPTIEPTLPDAPSPRRRHKAMKKADLRDSKPARSQYPGWDSNPHGLAANGV